MTGPLLLEAFAAAPPGMGDLVAAELCRIGAADPRSVPGGVAFGNGWREIYAANLRCRVAGRILVRAGSFPAATFRELERGLAAVPWRAWFAEGVAVAVRASARRSRLFHTGKLADLVRAASLAAEPEEEGTASATVFLRVEGDLAEVSLDSSGDHLHRRGYRTWTGEAPLRENLAAGLLLRAGYTPDTVLLDPCAGSGTFPVEGALLGRNLPPGENAPSLSNGSPASTQPSGKKCAMRPWTKCAPRSRPSMRTTSMRGPPDSPRARRGRRE